MVKNNNKNKVSKKSIHKKAKKSIHKKAKKSLHKITKKSVKKNSILKGGANKIYMKLFLMFRKFVYIIDIKKIESISLEKLNTSFLIFIQANLNDPIIKDVIINYSTIFRFCDSIFSTLKTIHPIIINPINKIILQELKNILGDIDNPIYKQLRVYFNTLDNKPQMAQGGATAGAGDSM
jgi:hypothetical protein